MKTLTEIIHYIEQELQKNWQSPLPEPEGLYEPIRYALSSGGKRLRPALVLMAYNLFREDIEKAVYPAIGLEIFHNFTLLHDDIMDKSPIRRGRSTVYRQWDENTAILSGDAMMIIAGQYISRCQRAVLKDVFDLYHQTALEVCEGQQYDMDFEQKQEVTEDYYLKMIRLKTSVLIGCCTKMGAILAEASPKQSDCLYDFGLHLGLAFQLQDDLLDVYGDEKTFGKPIGGDIANNKKTFLLIKAQQLAKDKLSEQLRGFLSDKSVNRDDKIKGVRDIYNQLSIRELTKEKIKQHHNKALDALNMLSVDPERKACLFELTEKLLNRAV